MTLRPRHLLVPAVLLLLATPAHAQFAGVVPAPPKPAPDPDSAARPPQLTRTQRDSMLKRNELDLKQWVDSAAGVNIPPASAPIQSSGAAGAAGVSGSLPSSGGSAGAGAATRPRGSGTRPPASPPPAAGAPPAV